MTKNERKAQEEQLANDLKKKETIQKYYQEHPDDEDAFLALISSSARASTTAASLAAMGGSIAGAALIAAPLAFLTAPIGAIGAIGKVVVKKKERKGQREKIGNTIPDSVAKAVEKYGADKVVKNVINTPERKIAYLRAMGTVPANSTMKSNSSKSDLELLEEMLRDIKELKRGQKETNRGMAHLFDQIASLSQQMTPCQELASSLLDSLGDGNEDSPVAERIYASFSNVCANTVMRRLAQEEPQSTDSSRESRVQLKSLFSDAIWNRLEKETQKSLITAKTTYDTYIRMDDSNTLDYTGVCALVSKAFEIECRKYFFERFRLYAKEHPQCSIPPEQQEALGLLAQGHFFTLGSVQYILPDFDKKSGEYREYRELLLSYARERLFSDSCGVDFSNDMSVLGRLDQYRSAVKRVKNKYRNRGIHGEMVSRQSAMECLEYVVEVERVLAKMVGAFRD